MPTPSDERIVDPSFELRLIEGIGPIGEYFLASALHHLFDSGLFDELDRRPGGASVDQLADALYMEHDRLRGFLLYLANEAVVEVERDNVRLTSKGRQYAEFRAWYTMMIGGYALTMSQLGVALARGAPACSRNARYVGMGSCEISRFDGIPMTNSLIRHAGLQCREVLDLGCGNGLYLVEFCRHMPGIRAWGSEPDKGGYEEAMRLVEIAGMSDRIRLSNASATEFLRDPPADCDPDLMVLSYVLHEVLGQEGEEMVLALLKGIVGRFPRIHIVVIEVANEIDNVAAMRHGLASAFWNPYFLLHYFTQQRLEKRAYWEDLFARAGLEIAGFTSTDPHVDSTGIELGYLLRRVAET